MKTFVISILTNFLLLNGVISQIATEKTYGTKYKDEIVSSIHLGDSSVITFMNKYHNDLSAISIFKTGKDDLPKWAKTTGFSYCTINSAIQTSDGNIAFAGYVPRPNQYSRERKNALVAKIDTAGNILWTRMFKFGTNAEASAIIQLPDSSLFITGLGNLQSIPDYRIVAIHLDKNGNEIKTYSYYQSNYNFASDAIFCHDSTIMIVGVERSAESKLLLANFNMNGEVQWNKVLTNGQWPQYIVANAITRDESNNYYITGNTEKGILCVKLNSGFDIEWSRDYGISENLSSAGEDILCLNDSVIIIAGNSFDKDIWTAFPRPPSDIVVIGINPHGDTLGTSSIGGTSDEYMVSLNRVSDSLLYISGSSYGFATEGDYDGYQINFIPGKSACNFTNIDWAIDTVEFEESAGIEVGIGLIAADSTITWMADTIGFHNACLCHPPTAFYNWYDDDGSVIATNLSVWATDWTWNIGLGQQSKEYHVQFVGDNIQLCLSVENECGSDEYCEIVYGGVAVPEINQISLEAFPVPSSDEVHLQFEIIEGYPDIRIFDATGKQVSIFPRYTQNTLTLSKPETGSGLFFVVFMLDSKVIALKKIIFE